MTLDEKGRCCGRKPIEYKGGNPHKFCTRCNRAFDSRNGEQVQNWAWRKQGDDFVNKVIERGERT